LSAPATIKGAALSKVSAKLVKLGLACEIEAKAGAPIWRRDDAGQGYPLKLTAAGLKAIAVDEGSPDAIEPDEAAQPQNGGSPEEVGHPARAAAPRDCSKLALVIDLLRCADGATIADLTQATGWLPHTTRAALTGLRKRGYAVIRERIDAGHSVYRILGRPFSQGRSHHAATRRYGPPRAQAEGDASGVVGMTRPRANLGDSATQTWRLGVCFLRLDLAQWDQAVDQCNEAVAASPQDWYPLVGLAAANAWASHDNEARKAAAQLQKIYPGFTVETWAGIHWSDDPTFKAENARIVEGLRKAGLPEQ
jgi:hypothetical protein